MAALAGKGDTVVVSSRHIKGRQFWAAAATSAVAVGMIAMSSAVALADDSESSDKPLPGTTIIRSADRGVANAGPSTVTGAARGTVYSDGDDASKGSPILIHDGNAAAACYAGGFDYATCNLPDLVNPPTGW